MSLERFLQSEDESPIGNVNDVLGAILAKFPESDQEESLMVAVRVDGEHIADLYALCSKDNVVVGFNMLGDNDSVVVDFLVEKFGVEELDM